MHPLKLLLAEIRYRKLSFALSVAAVTVAVALFVAGPVLVDGYSRQTQAELARLEDDTRKVMRDLGFNLMLVHRDTDVVTFLANHLPTIDMPQEFVDKLAKDRRLTLVTHLVGTLRAQIPFDGRVVLLSGYLPETPQAHMKHETPMGYTVAPGTVLLGHQLGQKHQPGQTIRVKDKEFRVAQVLPEQGNEEDGQIGMNLADAQALLGKAGKINLILALECRCGENALPDIRKQLTRTLPETQVIRDASKAVARARQREIVGQQRQDVARLMTTLLGVVTPLVVLAAAVWIGLLALFNVRERRSEIGLLRALGKNSAAIAWLFLGRAVLVGLAGGALGLLLGASLAWAGTARAFDVPTLDLVLRPSLLLAALAGAPLVAALASYLPTLTAVTQDPALVLRDA